MAGGNASVMVFFGAEGHYGLLATTRFGIPAIPFAQQENRLFNLHTLRTGELGIWWQGPSTVQEVAGKT